MKKIYYQTLILAGFLGFIVAVIAYNNVGTHPTINGAAVDAFQKNFIQTINVLPKFKKYIFVFDGSSEFTGPAVTKPGNFSIEEKNESKTPKEWLEHGGYSADEPEVYAALRHFYDPKGIKEGKHYLTNRGTYWEGLYPNPGIDAKTWALTHAENPWSWSAGIGWMKKALEESNQDLRDKDMAKAYRCLGETMHLLADMGCPPHVRNDSHAPAMALGLLGDPDPYEMSILASLVSLNKGNKTETTLKNSFRQATEADALFETMSTFTNENFFSNHTISGMGVRKIDPVITDQPAYPQPKLDDMEYVTEQFAFYKTFPSGIKVKMCKDHSYFNFRGYPYVDRECAESQSAELIPNIVEADANLIRLFIPALTVEISRLDADGTLNGTVGHTIDDEYVDQIFYNGPVKIYVDNKAATTLQADSGYFSGKLSSVQKTQKVTAEIEFGAIYVKSDPISPSDKPPNTKQLSGTFEKTLPVRIDPTTNQTTVSIIGSGTWQLIGIGLTKGLVTEYGVNLEADKGTAGQLIFTATAHLSTNTCEEWSGGNRLVSTYHEPKFIGADSEYSHYISGMDSVSLSGGDGSITADYKFKKDSYGSLQMNPGFEVRYDLNVYDKNGNLVSTHPNIMANNFYLYTIFLSDPH